MTMTFLGPECSSASSSIVFGTGAAIRWDTLWPRDREREDTMSSVMTVRSFECAYRWERGWTKTEIRMVYHRSSYAGAAAYCCGMDALGNCAAHSSCQRRSSREGGNYHGWVSQADDTCVNGT